MEKVFANLIVAGRKTIDDVPGNLVAAVEAELVKRGFLPPDEK